MKKLWLLTLTLLLGSLFTQVETSFAADCFYEANPTPVADQTFTMRFAGLFAIPETYTVNFTSVNKSFQITKSSSNNDGLVNITGGLPAANNAPFQVKYSGGTVCQGVLTVSSNSPSQTGGTSPSTTTANPGTCSFLTVPGHGGVPTQRTTTNNCESGYSPTAVVKGSNPPVQADPNSATAECRCLTSTQAQDAGAAGTTTQGLGKPASCIQTDLGCIPTEPGKLANVIFSILLGLAGGLAILMIIVGGFKVAMSQGNPDALEDGRDTITKAITGLVFILLATTILGIIGIDILGLGRFFQRTPGGITITP